MTVEKDEIIGDWRIQLRCELVWMHGVQWFWKVERIWNNTQASTRKGGDSFSYHGLDKQAEAEAKFEEMKREAIIDTAMETLGMPPEAVFRSEP